MCGRNRWLACVLGTFAALVATGAHADGGRVNFSGRIVEDTCPVGPDIQTGAGNGGAGGGAGGRVACGTPGSHNRSYDVTRTVLTGNEPDRVLRYFSDYVHASYADAQPTLVVRVYE
ncbi:hypothetical protein LQ772_00575 [Frateuria edaphi]|uniref:hypothetical protein n=1 Tax=Frateuria edaphi TaxID=2898793 RepID=UPI001E431421|nr:hypothetical protein [Frateuria edaphi]UGB45829.1 hypothetical protein LQ772_00575 [Frateuria edaphi]